MIDKKDILMLLKAVEDRVSFVDNAALFHAAAVFPWAVRNRLNALSLAYYAKKFGIVKSHVKVRHRLQIIDTPSGSCPIFLSSCDKADVVRWIDGVIWYGEKEGKHYTTKALKYFVRQTYPLASVQYNQVIKMIDQWKENTSKRNEV